MGRAVADQQRWFCVEDYSNARQPVLLLASGTLQECHHFIERCRLHHRPGHYRVNYTPAMQKLLRRTTAEAA